jgi:hypothetical protein
MRKIATLGAIAALGMSGAAFAAEGVSHSFVEAGYGMGKASSPQGLGTGKVDGDGFSIDASMEFPSNVIGFASYTDMGWDVSGLGDLDATRLSVGVGYKWSLNDSVDLVTGAMYDRVELDAGGPSLDGDGVALKLGLRSRLNDRLELGTTLTWSDAAIEIAPDTDLKPGFNLSASARYYFTPNFAGGIDVSKGSVASVYVLDQTTWGLSLRYDFGKLF